MSPTNGYADIEVKPESESARLRALRAYDILDTLQEQEFDAIAKLATRICDTPVSLINLIDTDRQWTKSATGMDISEILREEAVCQYTILDDQLESGTLQMKPKKVDLKEIIEEHQGTLFPRNENYRRQGTSGEKNTGMGLPLLKNLVDAHDGRIAVESEEGEAPKFTALFPALNPND